jgi:hypothetical protein
MPPKRIKLNHCSFDVFNLDTIEILAEHLDLQTYGRLRQSNKQLNLLLIDFEWRILQRVQNKESVAARALIVQHKCYGFDADSIIEDLDVDDNIWNTLPLRGFIDELNPNNIKRYGIPSTMIDDALTKTARLSDNLSLEFALQGLCKIVCRKAEDKCKSRSEYKFSKWNPTDKVNIKKVKALMEYSNIDCAIENEEFAYFVYNQLDLQLLRVCPAWQSIELFLKYRELPYTENDIKTFGWSIQDLVDTARGKIKH